MVSAVVEPTQRCVNSKEKGGRNAERFLRHLLPEFALGIS